MDYSYFPPKRKQKPSSSGGGRSHFRSHSSLANCVIEFNPTTQSSQGFYHVKFSDHPVQSHYTSSSSRVHSSRPLRSNESSHVWSSRDGHVSSGRDGRASSGSTYLLSRTKRQTAHHELLNSAMGEHIIFTESPAAPGVPIVFRLPEERMKNPERLNLDRRNLAVCPILEGEEKLRLLNLQHNLLRHIENLSHLRRLVYLDLYDNSLEEISGISELISLRILMLGRNKIRHIGGLETLTQLDVLDLHGNQISEISGLNGCMHLRVLNLAGNMLTAIAGVNALKSLTELNVKRNKIRTIFEIDQLPSLQRLFLSYNLIEEWNDVECLSESQSITELSLEGNPFSHNEGGYRLIVLSQMSQLHHLDMIPISEEERLSLTKLRESEDAKKQDKEKRQLLKQRRDSVISKIQRQWERARSNSDQMGSLKSSSSVSIVSKESSSEGTLTRLSSNLHSPSESSVASVTRSDSRYSVAVPGIGYIEVVNGQLHLYALRSLEDIQKERFEGPPAAITGIVFHFISFKKIVPFLGKIGSMFPSCKHLEFHCTGLATLMEVNALACLSTLDSLVISEEGNPITSLTHWRSYLFYRLSHLSLASLNKEEITAEAMITSEQIFGGLGSLATSLLPQSRLLDFVKRQKNSRKGSRKKSTTQQPVSRAPLLYHSNDTTDIDQFEKHSIATVSVFDRITGDLIDGAVKTNANLKIFEEVFPQIFEDAVRECFEEMRDLDVFMRKTMTDLLKSS